VIQGWAGIVQNAQLWVSANFFCFGQKLYGQGLWLGMKYSVISIPDKKDSSLGKDDFTVAQDKRE
jgi:hypothetical protein